MRYRPGRTSDMTGEHFKATWVCPRCTYTARSWSDAPRRCVHGHGEMSQKKHPRDLAAPDGAA